MVLPEVTTLAEARNAIRDLAEENEKLSNELAWFRRQLFGSKTEHYIPEDDTPSLFPEEMSPESPKEVPTATVAEHERKVRQANALSEIPVTASSGFTRILRGAVSNSEPAANAVPGGFAPPLFPCLSISPEIGDISFFTTPVLLC